MESQTVSLYDKQGLPSRDFNRLVMRWLQGDAQVRGHNPPIVFKTLRSAYDKGISELLISAGDVAQPQREAHRALLSGLTQLMLGDNIQAQLAERLDATSINVAGFRSQLSQGMAKNTGENFINIIAYALAVLLSYQDEVLVDKNLARPLRNVLRFARSFTGADGQTRHLDIPIEGDLTIWSRSNPTKAIIVNAKTRMKEITHIVMMWKLLFDMLDDPYCQKKWGLVSANPAASMHDVHYVFATADMISGTGKNTQGGDVEREGGLRNLLAVDMSFLDYAFVSKQSIPHVASELNLARGREALFHELGCLIDLVEQKFGIALG